VERFRVEGLSLKILSSGFRVGSLGLRVQDVRFQQQHARSVRIDFAHPPTPLSTGSWFRKVVRKVNPT